MNIFKYIRKTIALILILFCLTLAFQSPSYAVGIEESSWKLESISGKPVAQGDKFTVDFNNKGGIRSKVGCNSQYGTFNTDSGKIKINFLSFSRAYCPIEGDYLYIGALQSATSYKVSDQNLELTYDGSGFYNDPAFDGDGSKTLKFVKAG